MLHDVLLLLRDSVNGHISACSGIESSQTDQGRVSFVGNESLENPDFKLGSVSLLLVNVEQEFSLRTGDPYRVAISDGNTLRTQPPIHLNLYVLFVARFKDYERSLSTLSLILQFFQNHRVFDHETAPALNPRIEKIVMELLTLPFAELQNIWSLLRAAYLPSLLYKARMVAYHDEDALPAAARMADAALRIRR